MSSLDLLDYRRRVAEIYRDIRKTDDPKSAWDVWKSARQALFASHPESPWPAEERRRRRLEYFSYDPAWRTTSPLDALADDSDVVIGHSGSGSTPFRPIGTVDVPKTDQRLTVYWLAGYGGGVFIPFRDATNRAETYGGGRYLLDTVKGADLGNEGDRLVLDFNFAYHPSCVHSPRWSCPLAPPANHLPVAVRAGERLP